MIPEIPRETYAMKPVPTNPMALQSRIFSALIDDIADPKARRFERLDDLRSSMIATNERDNEEGKMDKGGISGSREPSPSVSAASGFDPGRVFVVMGNDFPDAAFTTEAAAEAYCARKREDDRKQYRQMHGQERPSYAHGIYWRVYDFPLLTGETA